MSFKLKTVTARDQRRALLAPVCLAFFAGILLAGCGGEDRKEVYLPTFSESPVIEKYELVLGIHPLFNPQKLFAVFNPLASYIEHQLPEVGVKVEASKDYPAYDTKIHNRQFDLLLPNPYQTIMALDHQYQVIAKAGKDDLFRGIILVRKDSGIDDIKDLKNGAIAYPAPTALAATMMPQYHLHTHGLNLKNDTTTRYVGSQESSMMNAILKLTDASATWPLPWKQLQQNKPDLANQLRVLASTPSLPNNSIMINQQTVSPQVAKRIQVILSEMHLSAEGRAILQNIGIQHIFVANNASYDPVIYFLEKFRQVIGDNAQLGLKQAVEEESHRE